MVATTNWKSGVNGDWNSASDWTNGVPNGLTTALITAKGSYDITSTALNSAGILQMEKGATINVSNAELAVGSGTGGGALAGQITVSNSATLGLGSLAAGATFNNTGTIKLGGGVFLFFGPGKLAVTGTVTLAGKGQVDLTDPGSEIISGSGGATLSNDGNTIAGEGTLGDANMSFSNQAKGVVDANNSNGGTLLFAPASANNLGTMEASAGGALQIDGTVINSTSAKIETVTSSKFSQILLDNSGIENGTISIAKDTGFSNFGGTSIIDPSRAIANAGVISTIGGVGLALEAALNNGKTGALLAFDSELDALDKVTGGTAEIEGSGVIDFGSASSANVTFAAGATGQLGLSAPKLFTGTVSGMANATDASIELANIPFADNPSVSPLSKGVLTVTDLITGVVDKIKIAGGGTFAAQSGPNGITSIFDPPPSALGAPAQSTQLIAQAVASFGATGGITAAGSGYIADSDQAGALLATAPHSHR